MSQHRQHRPDPADALRRLALEAAPPSRMDVTRAARDGFRLRRRRRVARSLTGVATAGVVAAAAVLLPAHLAAPDRTSAPATSTSGTAAASPNASASCPSIVDETAAPVGADYRMEVPGRFGWLPADEVSQITETVANSGYGSGGDPYVTTAASATNADVDVYLSVYAYAAEVPGQHVPAPPGCPSDALDSAQEGGAQQSYEIAAPDVNGGDAYWFTLKQGVIDDAGMAELVWRTPAGTWASVTGTDLDPNTVVSTLEHVADTATVGTVALPTPVQIEGIPATSEMQAGQVVITQAANGDSSGYSIQVALTFGTGDSAVGATVMVYPPGQNPGPADPYWDTDCTSASGWEVCAGISQQTDEPGPLPDGASTLMHDLLVHGQDPSTWSADLITGTK